MSGKTEGDFTLLFETCSAALYAYAVRRLAQEDVEDVVAETFLVAWRRREVIPDDPFPWLYGVARKVIANRRRTLRRQRALNERAIRVSTPPDSAHNDTELPPVTQALSQSLEVLRDSQREALFLTYWENLNTRDAAIVAGCSETAFAIRLHRARRALATELSRRQGPDGESSQALPVVARDL